MAKVRVYESSVRDRSPARGAFWSGRYCHCACVRKVCVLPHLLSLIVAAADPSGQVGSEADERRGAAAQELHRPAVQRHSADHGRGVRHHPVQTQTR